jgi:dTDP-4-amino-4,6-dideoxygalactose transaminase
VNPIPMLDLKREYEYMKKDIDAAIGKCLEHQKWIFGPEVKELEDKIADYTGVKHCVGCSSGTESLVLSLRALAIKTKGQEYFDRSDLIITTPFTFTATGDAILRSGATPVFVDIDPATYNIDPVQIREALVRSKESGVKSSKGRPANSSPLTPHSLRVVGIVPVHLYGFSCEMEEILGIAAEHGLFVVEDVAQAFGGMWKGRRLGSIGDTGSFSFFPSKNLGGFGDGGMVSTDDDEVAGLVRMLLKHGGKDKYNVDHIGYNARLDTLHAAVLLAKFKYIDEFNDRRRRIAEIYSRELSGVEGLILPCTTQRSDGSTFHVPDGHVFHQYTVRVPDGRRDELQSYLKERGVSTMVYYPVPLQKMKVFDGRSEHSGELPGSEKAVNEVLSLPMEPLMSEEEVRTAAETLRKFF